jgi:hypothetical protein
VRYVPYSADKICGVFIAFRAAKWSNANTPYSRFWNYLGVTRQDIYEDKRTFAEILPVQVPCGRLIDLLILEVKTT